MPAGTARTLETTFISTDRFDQRTFKRWVETRPATDINHYELADGRIVMTPPAGWGHGEVGSRANRNISDFVDKHKLGKVFDSSTGYDLPTGDTLEPDVSFISSERWAKGPHVGRRHFLRIVPNLVVEILSASTEHRDRGEKRKIYEANGVDELWLVDPTRREVTIFQLVGGRYGQGRRYGIRQTLRSRSLPEFRAPVRFLFS
jgi:Uma2 family endonuclease